MALAGTRACGTGGAWGEKETEEQQIVSRYIGDLLDGFGKWDVKGPFTRKAGKIEHLCTAFFMPGTCPGRMPTVSGSDCIRHRR